MRFVHPFIRRSLLLLVVAAPTIACSDELGSPQSQECDVQLAVPVTEPARVLYGVNAENAAVESVTYTTAEGDTTVTSFPDQDTGPFDFDREAQFSAATDATLNAVGEVGTGGEIVISYEVIPDDGSTTTLDFTACQG